MTEKYYQLGTHTAEQYHEIHDLLCSATDGVANIPNRVCTCNDDKPHSPTRGTFTLTQEEATSLKSDPRIKFLNEDFIMYPETYKAPPEEIQASSPDLLNRWQGNVKVIREFEDGGVLPSTPDSTDINRGPWGLTRHAQKLDPWIDESRADNYVYTTTVQQYGDGADVDVIVADDGGGWIGHPEFQNNCTGSAPDGYTGGNVLPGNGTCDVLDLYLDSPYYLDPDYFDADAGNRLTTRWDGTTVPVESFARGWWQSTDNRSEVFNSKHPNAGTFPIQDRNSYTRAYCNGSNTAQSSVGQHCTPCMALAYGRTQGWAYNANKWVINNYGTNGVDIDMCFDLQKIFHQVKPINSKYGTQDPTISSNSWGYRAGKGSAGHYYHFRGADPVAYGGQGDPTEPRFLSHMGTQGDTYFGTPRWKSEMKTNIYTTALDEAIDAGVIFVMAAGNSNQKQVNWDHQDFNNYIASNSVLTLPESSYFEFGIEVTGTTNRRGFPQQGGLTITPGSTFTFNATAPAGTAYYRIVGTDRTGAIDYNNGPITMRAGDTIELTNDADSSHTMFIKTSATTGASDQVSGATGQGAHSGSTITWTPTVVGTYYYRCLNHISMGGEIRVTAQEQTYKTINIGALDDEYDVSSGNRERKVGYSDRGEAIDAYFAADGILAANRSYFPNYRYPDTYTGFTADSGTGSGIPEDCAFGGTSAACPVGAGFIATLVGLNRNWTYADVKTYFANLDNQDPTDFYPGTESTSADDVNWEDYTSLEGGNAKVAYQDISQLTQTTPPKRAASFGTGLNLSGLNITRVNRFDRGR
jgi:plastocyanin